MNYYLFVKNNSHATPLVASLRKAFQAHANKEKAAAMEAYMKHLFPFLGLQKPEREQIYKAWMQQHAEALASWNSELLGLLWEQPEREFQYVAMALMNKWKQHLQKNQAAEIEYYLTHASWWDTVDFLASNIAGKYFALYPGMRESLIPRWNQSGNLWLNRTAILFQLQYGKATDLSWLEAGIEQHKHSKEFFHRKAIGWALRTAYRHFPDYVLQKAEDPELSNLSRREALKHAEKK